MIRKTLKLQILVMILVVLTVGISFLYYYSFNELKSTLDRNQSLFYKEKINNIISLIEEKYNKLQSTGMVDAYEHSFKKGTIDSIEKIYLDHNKGVYQFILNEKKEFILYPKFLDVDKKNNINYDNFFKKFDSKDGDFYLRYNHDNRWVIFKHFKQWDWIIGYSISEDVKNREINEYRNKFLLIVLIILSVVSILIVFSVRHTLAPIERLIFESNKIAEGNLTSDIKINGSYELTQLSKSFSLMRNKIRENLYKLENTNEELEKKVDERTKELKSTISDLKNMQKQLVESEKIASLGSLVAGVAHEINTPIGIGVTGITHFLSISSDLNKKYKEDNLSETEFEDFIKTSNELANLINVNLMRAADLIKSFKKVAIDRSSEEKRKFNVKSYLEEILMSLHSITKKTKHQYNIECPSDLEINNYPGLFSQIITNFIMNSLIHGFKEIKAGKIDIVVYQENKILNILYRDNGCGIKKENLKKIYEPFFTTNRSHGGSGLGLNIVHNIVTTQLNGTISAKSEFAKGVEFLVKFPI